MEAPSSDTSESCRKPYFCNSLDIVSFDDQGQIVASSDDIDFSSSLSLDKKTSDKYLILALVQELCTYIEPTNKDVIFNYFLQHLVRRKLVPDHYASVGDRDFTGYAKAFKTLLTSITHQMTLDLPTTVLNNGLIKFGARSHHEVSNHQANPHSHSETPMYPIIPNIPRFKLDFNVLSTLGKGGFGRVFKAQHNIDGMIYAVKRVNIKDRKPAYIAVREVKILAKLDHPNIVRYHNCWLETDFSVRRGRRMIKEVTIL